jgi:cytochrome c553
MTIMSLSRAITVCAIGSLAAVSMPALADGDPAAGTAYPDVYTVPKLGSQGAGYIIKALHDYKSGARKHPSMIGIAASLSDKDIADLAAYYSGEGAK